MPVLHELYYHDVRLKQLHLQNFRGFGEVTLDFNPEKPVTVLIADNGGGKSTILDAVAEFLRRFFQLAIAGKNENDDKETLLGEKDIFNERTNAIASVMLNLSYPYPGKEVFQWMDDCARHLEENHIEGEEATLYLEGEVWTLQLKQKEEFITYYLPDEFQKRLDTMASDEGKSKILSAENLNFEVAAHDGTAWRPNLSLSGRETSIHAQRNGSLKMEFELTRGRPDPMKHYPLPAKPNTYAGFIKAWEDGEGFIPEYGKSTSGYNRHNPLDESPEILPLLVYYGGAAINTMYDNELKVPYRHGEFQANSHAFKPDRFDFEEFLTWALWAYEKQKHAWNIVIDTILDVMNADDPDSRKYDRIEIEAQTLIFYKKTGVVTMPVEAAQLSVGEQNIMALVGDLVKRAVQLNVMLFNVDFDLEEGTLSNPLRNTPGIVLIDEIDLHLHPRWQREIVPKLREHFPRMQFVVTTHSPFVLQGIKPEYSFIVSIKDFHFFPIDEGAFHFGREAQDIAYVMQRVSLRLPEIKEKIDSIYQLIDEGKLKDAKHQTDELAKYLSEQDSEIIKIRTLIEFHEYDVDNQE